jgi:glutathione peroxidase
VSATLFRPWTSIAVAALTAIALSSAARAEGSTPVTDACPQVLNFSFNRLQTGKPESLCQYCGMVVLIVNTASYCGYTHQYEGLEALYRKYKSRGLVVVGFPSNDFGGQEPGSNDEIAEFCRLTYGVEFPMFEKSSVTSIKTNPLYAELLARTGQSPKWNFHKYLVDRNGKQITSFGTRVEPDNVDLISAVERMLAARPALPKS